MFRGGVRVIEGDGGEGVATLAEEGVAREWVAGPVCEHP